MRDASVGPRCAERAAQCSTNRNESPTWFTRLTLRAKPTMFKRVDRRRKRKKEEENLGLDEDERDVLGLNDTDSSESDSDSSESSSSQGPSRRSARSKNKRKRRSSLRPDRSDDDEDSPSTSGDEMVDGEDIVADHLLSIASALKEPIQLISTHPEAWVCAFCPNKILKHGAMVKVHEASQARKLRMRSGHHAYHAS